MGEKLYYASCNTVPTLVGSEVRFSFAQADLIPIPNLPIKYVTCAELTPPQLRTQWGVATSGARADIEVQGYTIIANVGDQDSDLEGGHGGCQHKLPDPYDFIP